MSDTDAAVQAFNQHVAQLEEQYGVELDAAERQHIFGMSVANGFSPDSTLQAFGELVDIDEGPYDEDEDDFEEETVDESEPDPRLVRHLQDDVDRLSAEYGRRLTARETEIIVNGALEQADRYDQINAKEALDDHYQATRETRPDTNTQTGRHEFYRQRLEEQNTPTVPDRELDLDNTQDRHAFLQARMQGVEFETGGDEAA